MALAPRERRGLGQVVFGRGNRVIESQRPLPGTNLSTGCTWCCAMRVKVDGDPSPPHKGRPVWGLGANSPGPQRGTDKLRWRLTGVLRVLLRWTLIPSFTDCRLWSIATYSDDGRCSAWKWEEVRVRFSPQVPCGAPNMTERPRCGRGREVCLEPCKRT